MKKRTKVIIVVVLALLIATAVYDFYRQQIASDEVPLVVNESNIPHF